MIVALVSPCVYAGFAAEGEGIGGEISILE